MQNIGEVCTMYPYTETETPLPILSPCVSVREYRGSARRARGLKQSNSNNRVSYSPPAVSRSLTGCREQYRGDTEETIVSEERG